MCEEEDGSAGKNAKIASVELRIKSQTLESGGCSSHWQHVFELQTRGWFFDTFPSVETEHLKAQIGEEFLCTLASSHLMW